MTEAPPDGHADCPDCEGTGEDVAVRDNRIAEVYKCRFCKGDGFMRQSVKTEIGALRAKYKIETKELEAWDGAATDLARVGLKMQRHLDSDPPDGTRRSFRSIIAGLREARDMARSEADQWLRRSEATATQVSDLEQSAVADTEPPPPVEYEYEGEPHAAGWAE